MSNYLLYSSPFGNLVLSSSDHAIDGLWFVDQKYFPNGVPHHIPPAPTSPMLQEAKNWLDAYCQGHQPSPKLLPLQLNGSEFQIQIWKLLLDIPYGSVVSYAQLAQQYSNTIGISRMSAQAVGAAVSRNPISIIVPCHRVIGATGALIGYAGGIEKKEALLKHEGCRFYSVK